MREILLQPPEEGEKQDPFGVGESLQGFVIHSCGVATCHRWSRTYAGSHQLAAAIVRVLDAVHISLGFQAGQHPGERGGIAAKVASNLLLVGGGALAHVLQDDPLGWSQPEGCQAFGERGPQEPPDVVNREAKALVQFHGPNSFVYERVSPKNGAREGYLMTELRRGQ